MSLVELPESHLATRRKYQRRQCERRKEDREGKNGIIVATLFIGILIGGIVTTVLLYKVPHTVYVTERGKR